MTTKTDITPEDPLRAEREVIWQYVDEAPEPFDKVSFAGWLDKRDALAAPPVAGAEWKDAIRERLAREDWRTADGLSVIVPIWAAEAVLRSTAPALDVDDPRFRDAVDAVFAAPGEFGPAKGYYGGDIDHFIDMLRAALR